MKLRNVSVAQQQVTTKALYKLETVDLSTMGPEDHEIAEADSLEVISLVDNTADFLSTIDRKEAQSFRQWTKKRYGENWTRIHSQLPTAEHGFSMLVRLLRGGKTTSVLFDTGGSAEGVVKNATRMGIELNEVEHIVLSHGHYDHCGGLLSVLKRVEKNTTLVLHEDMFKKRGTVNLNGTIRNYVEFPTEEQLVSANVIKTKQPQLVSGDMVLVTGEIPRKTSFENGYLQHRAFINGTWQSDSAILDDRAIISNVKGKGLVIISGCAHAGIINTVAYAQRISGIREIYAVMGGFHLAGKENEKRIKSTVMELTKINPRLIAPMHCTGWRGMTAIEAALPEAFVWNSVGNLYSL